MSNYDNAASASSGTDDETPVCSDGDAVDNKDVDGPAVGVAPLEAPPQTGHAPLTLEGAEVREGRGTSPRPWRLRAGAAAGPQRRSGGELGAVAGLGLDGGGGHHT